MPSLVDMGEDVLGLCAQFLGQAETARCLFVSRAFVEVLDGCDKWQAAGALEFGPAFAEGLEPFLTGTRPRAVELYQLACCLWRPRILPTDSWVKPAVDRRGDGLRLRSQEGHGAVLVGPRHLLTVAGWGPTGVGNEATIADVTALPAIKHEFVHVGLTPAALRPRYGFSLNAVAAAENDDAMTAVMFGGMTFGGYTGEVNEARLLRVC